MLQSHRASGLEVHVRSGGADLDLRVQRRTLGNHDHFASFAVARVSDHADWTAVGIATRHEQELPESCRA